MAVRSIVAAPVCPSLPERPRFRIPCRKSGRRLRYSASRLSARRSPLFRPSMRRALRQFRGTTGSASDAFSMKKSRILLLTRYEHMFILHAMKFRRNHAATLLPQAH
jgi:hypothetical protein